MRIDFHTHALSPSMMAEVAREVEASGYDALWTTETKHDPFLGLAIAAQHTRTARLGTGLAVAFARNPMTTAMLANDLQLASEGRFMLGLGSQIQSHITRRFSMPWSAPAARMREYILAVRAIWDTFATGRRLRFRGTYYRHTQMSEYFNPGPHRFGSPPILLAAVGEKMTEVAGEVADGYLAHLICTRRHLTEVAIPALRRARERIGCTMEGFQIHATPIVVTGHTEPELAAAAAQAREQVAFYASIPTYGPLLELHGLGGLRDELHRLAGAGRLADMPSAIDDSVLNTFTIVGEPRQIAAKVYERFGEHATSMAFYSGDNDPQHWLPIYDELRRLRSAAAGSRCDHAAERCDHEQPAPRLAV